MKARDLMTSNPVAVTPDESITRAAEIMRDLDVGIVPVVDDVHARHLVGVLTDRDIAVRCVARKHGVSCTVGDHMTHGRLDTIHPNEDASTVISLMELDQVRRIPVVSDDNRLEGIIAQADIAAKLESRAASQVEEVLEHISRPHPT